ncbi:MAG: ASKHA domain-containing protein [Planctomycetota bacterium]
MRESEVPVTFQPLGKQVHVLKGTRLMEAAAGAGIALDLPCGGEGVCGKCRVVVRRGASRPSEVEQGALAAGELEEGFRLACQSSVGGPMTVEIPETSVLASYHKILAHTEKNSQAAVDPAVRKQYVELRAPDRQSHEADLVRLEHALGPFQVDLDVLRKMPGLLREEHFRGTAVLADRKLIDFEPGDTASECFGVAFDIGTTTLVGVLLNLNDDRELAVSSRLNPQTSFGDDVLTRIQHASESPQGLAELHEAVAEACDEMIGELADQAGIVRTRIYELTFSGNTTMLHLLLRVDPRYLGEVPFVPATGRAVTVGAVELGLRIHPRGRAYLLPVIGGFVGGDTVAGILATGLAQAQGPTLFVDIGTNGEIVLLAEGKLAAAATAAGPAFEGARITHGMRGSTGAIEKVIVDGQVRINVIGNTPPVGLCGSALIDLAAGLLRHRILTPEGRLPAPDELPDDVLPELRRRVMVDEGKVSFLVVPETESGTGRPIVLTQRDVRQLQLASGAIRAGIAILLKRAGLRPEDLEAVLIGGGFGNFIRRSNAQRIGLLPGEIARSRIRYQGNTSLAGARLVAVSVRARTLAEELARRTEHVDLSTDPGFQWAFADAMIFPEGG